jgi:hypothetical protein
MIEFKKLEWLLQSRESILQMRFLPDKPLKLISMRMIDIPTSMDRLTHLAFSFDFQEKDFQDFYEQNPIIVRELIYRFNDDNPGGAEGSTQSIRRAVKACTDRGACELCRVHGESDFQHGHRCQTKNRRSSR